MEIVCVFAVSCPQVEDDVMRIPQTDVARVFQLTIEKKSKVCARHSARKYTHISAINGIVLSFSVFQLYIL